MIRLLEGVRVVECATLVQGDHTGRLFGDLGADVVKVEMPGTGDYLRDIGGALGPRQSPPHLVHNRNKRSLALNLRSDAGREVFFELIADADVFVDGFAGDACTRLGIGYEAQRAVNPDIIYCQSSGFGATGPYAQIPVHGYMMMALGGALHLEMCEDGFVRETPDPDAALQGSFSAPVVGALYAVVTALAALRHRDRTGEGACIDASGADAALALRGADAVHKWHLDRLQNADNVPRIGHPHSPKYDYYETQDGRFVVFACIEPKFWRNFCKAIDRPDMSETHDGSVVADFGDTAAAGLAAQLQTIFHTRTLAEWVRLALDHDFALGPANQNEDLLGDPHLRAREILFTEENPNAGTVHTVGWPAPVRGQRFDVARVAPNVGEHTDEVLAEIGLSAARIAGLHESSVAARHAHHRPGARTCT